MCHGVLCPRVWPRIQTGRQGGLSTFSCSDKLLWTSCHSLSKWPRGCKWAAGTPCLLPTAEQGGYFLRQMWVMNRGEASGPIKFYKNRMPRAYTSMTHAHRDDKLSVWDVSWVGDPVALGAVAGGAVRHKPHLRRVSFPFSASPECAGEQARLLVSCFSAPVTSPLSKLGNHSHISKNHSVFSLRFYRISPHPTPTAATALPKQC